MSEQRKKFRIAFFGDDFSRKGKGTALVIRKIAEEIVANHPDIEVVLIRPEGKCGSSVCSKARHVIVPRKFSTLFSYMRFFVTHRERYDSMVFNRVVYPLFWFLRANKFILYQHDASKSEIYFVVPSAVNRCFELFLKYLGQHFLDTVVTDSDDAKKWVSRQFRIPELKVKRIYNGVGEEFRQFDEAERASARSTLEQKYRLRSPYILNIARFDPHKNLENLLDAYFLLKQGKSVPHTLVLVGGRHLPGYSDIVEEKIRVSPYNNDIIVLKYVEEDDLPAVYNCAEVLMYPSLVEGFGLPPLEAMKCGTPVVTSNISCLPEVMGDAAVLVDPLDPKAIADGVSKVLKDKGLQGTLIQKGLQRAAMFSWKTTTDEFVTLITK